ncbi:MAG: hypothetical protein WAU78_02640 [Roseiarcus sp.]
MEEELKELLLIAHARIAVLMQLVRLLLLDRAIANHQTSDDILRWSEDLKSFFEQRTAGVPGLPDAYLSAVIDDLFNFLATEVKKSRGES